MTAALHTCDGCGRAGRWDVRWRWFGSYAEAERGEPILRLCSSACLKPAQAQHGRRRLPDPSPAELAAWQRHSALSELAAQVAATVLRLDALDQAAAARAVGRGWRDAEFQAALRDAARAGAIRIVRRRRSGAVELHPPKEQAA